LVLTNGIILDSVWGWGMVDGWEGGWGAIPAPRRHDVRVILPISAAVLFSIQKIFAGQVCNLTLLIFVR
jgi:hypothetical protein